MRVTVAAVGFLLVIGWWAPASRGTTVLLDFEDAAEIALWHDERKPPGTVTGKTLTQEARFTASGSHSLRFTTPAWRPEEHGGRHIWPAFEGAPPVSDWSAYDRLVFEVVNVTAVPQRLMLFITDGKTATRSGLRHRERIEPHGHRRVVVDVRKGFRERKLDATDVRRMHFYTESPPEDMVVYLDRLLLLKPGEAVPALSEPFLRDLRALQTPKMTALKHRIKASVDRMAAAAQEAPRVREWARRTGRDTLAAIAQFEAPPARLVETEVMRALDALERLEGDVARAEGLFALRLEFEGIRDKVQEGNGAQGRDTLVAFADSMSKILPRAEPGMGSLSVAPSTSLCLAQNETESLQVAVIPQGVGLQDVSVTVSGLTGPGGARFPDNAARSVPMGYVRTRSVPPYGSDHVGWWPDPILDFLPAVSVAKGDVQSFWVRVRAPRDQRPGQYHGKLAVKVGARVAFEFDLTVRVYAFTLPDRTPLPSAITFFPKDRLQEGGAEESAEWRERPDFPVTAWQRQIPAWTDFLADYFITTDSLYEYTGWAPRFEQLVRLRDQGRLGRFNLGYYGACGESPEAIATWEERAIGRIRPRYEKARKLGLLEYAYIYGCDEHKAKEFPRVERAAARLRKAFPGVMIMTTTYDHSFGEDSPIQSMDAFCPLTPRYDRERADAVRAKGKQVWWYICCGPRHPHANMFVEYPAIEGRLLMGAMTAKYRPDGFLYYQTSIWNSRKVIDQGPYTEWNPRSWTTYHGDGSWVCVGPDGMPLPTIRLENFRDGLEDYAYARLLESVLVEVERRGGGPANMTDWVGRARELLAVPESLVASMTTYSRDPGQVRRWRRDMAEAIETAAVPVSWPGDVR